MKATKQYFPVILVIVLNGVVRTFESVDENLNVYIRVKLLVLSYRKNVTLRFF